VAGINNPPNIPSNPSPVNHATGVSIDADLSWTGGDPDVGDTVTYDVYFGTSASPPLASNDQSATTYDPGTLNNNTKYYWNIVATDNHAASTSGPVWDFTTGGAVEDCPWLDEEPKSGTVPPGGEADITVTFDTTGLGSTYTANIIISSNDPGEPQVIVPVTLTVTTGVAPSVSIEPQSRTVSPGGTCDIDVWVDAAGRGLAGIDVAVQYNSDVMTTTVADVEAHNLLGGMEIGPEVTEAAGVGEVAYALASGAAVAGVDASIMTITFTMDPDAEPGVYPLTVSKADLSDLGGTWGDTETNDGTVTVTTGRKGDFDGDGDIDIFDFVMFAAAYGSELGDENYNPAGDFEPDGDIDIFDFVQFAAVYGT